MITVLDYIKNHLHLEVVRHGINFFCLSPFTNEKTASFCIFEKTNSYYDYSGSFGGDVVDLHKRLNGLDRKMSYKELVMDNLTIGSIAKFDVIHQDKREIKKSTFEIISILPLSNIVLLDYAKSRGIPRNIAKENCKELTYKIKDKYTFNAICFINDKQGLEIRNSKFKGGFNKKWITTIQGKNGSSTLDIFEGFLDYLSYLALHKITMPINKTIVLNSLSMQKLVIPENETKKIRLFLDNDNAGDVATRYFLDVFPFMEVDDQRVHYKEFNDLNDYLTHRLKKKNIIL